MELDDYGIPARCRKTLWGYYLGNKQKINREIFKEFYHQSKDNFDQNNLIYKDIQRTFCQFTRNKAFNDVLSEANILLRVFLVSLKAIQARFRVCPGNELPNGLFVAELRAILSLQDILQHRLHQRLHLPTVFPRQRLHQSILLAAGTSSAVLLP